MKQKLEERNRLRTEIIRYFDGFHGKLSYAEHNSLEKIDAIYDDFLTQFARENFAEEMVSIYWDAGHDLQDQIFGRISSLEQPVLTKNWCSFNQKCSNVI